MSKIDCRNRLKNGCCILTGGECTHETCTTKEPELQYGNNSKYEEALERARKGMPIDEVFPELRESEDERIRKALIRFFKNTHDWVNLKYDGNEIVAYLEKQKEQKPVHTAKEMWKEMRLEAYAQASGNRHEPNYSDDSTKMFSLCDIDEIFEKIGNSTVGSQPAEWSEEDNEKNRCPLNTKEIKVGDIITYFRDGKKGIMLVSSLDSGIYPRCKWGITDIDGTAYGDWAPGSGPYYTATEKERQQLYDTMPREVKDWFESFRPKPQWKPSEEQMKALKLAYEDAFDCPEGGVPHLPLQSLYQDLQKLL